MVVFGFIILHKAKCDIGLKGYYMLDYSLFVVISALSLLIIVDGASDEESAVDFDNEIVSDDAYLLTLHELYHALVQAAIDFEGNAVTALHLAFAGDVANEVRHTLERHILWRVVAFGDDACCLIAPTELFRVVAKV